MSLVTGDTRAAVDGWAAVSRIGFHGDVLTLPAKTVEAWQVLDVEREALRREDDAE